MISFSVFLIGLSFTLLSLPGLLLSDTSSFKKTKFIYLFSTLSASIILSLRLAGADTTRYLDIYELCSLGDPTAAASFLDFFTPLLCNFAVITKYAPISSFIHFFIALVSLYAPPVFDKKLRDSLHPSFFRLYPIITSITVLLGYFLSPHRQAAASILLVYFFITKRPFYFIFAVLLHFNTFFIGLFMFPFFEKGVRFAIFRFFKSFISIYSILILFLSGFLVIVLLFFFQPLYLDLISRLLAYSQMFLMYIQNLNVIAAEFGSIFGGYKIFGLCILLLALSFWIIKTRLDPYVKLYIIISFILYPIGTIGRIALPAILFASYYYCTHPFNVKPHFFFITFLLFVSLLKVYPTISSGRIAGVTGWLHQGIPRDYFNAYQLHYLYSP